MHLRRNNLKKNTLKYFIDTLLFIDMSSIAVLGLLLGFVIPRGKVNPANKYFLGLHRHQWGDIHLYLSLFLLVLLVIHIWFNWTWIVQSTKRYFGNHWKNFLWAFSCAWIIVLFIGWVVVRSWKIWTLYNMRLEQTTGESRFNAKTCKWPVQDRTAAQAAR